MIDKTAYSKPGKCSPTEIAEAGAVAFAVDTTA